MEPYPVELIKAVDAMGLAFARYYFDEDLLRSDDVFLAAHPRSGSHFVRFLISSALELQSTGTLPRTLAALQRVPDLHVTDLRTENHTPRIIKTHFPQDPRYRKVVHLVRDPRDVAASYYRYTLNRPQLFYERPAAPPSPAEFVERWLDGGVWPGGWIQHSESYTSTSTANGCLQVRYEDLLRAPVRETGRLFQFLGVTIDQSVLESVLAHASFANMADLFNSRSARPGCRHGGATSCGKAA